MSEWVSSIAVTYPDRTRHFRETVEACDADEAFGAMECAAQYYLKDGWTNFDLTTPRPGCCTQADYDKNVEEGMYA